MLTIEELEKRLVKAERKNEELEEKLNNSYKEPKKLPEEWLELREEINEFCKSVTVRKHISGSTLQEAIYRIFKVKLNIQAMNDISAEQAQEARFFFENVKEWLSETNHTLKESSES
ncbi:hypothetical protein ACYRFT_01380 [Listeria kieliensis]